MIHRAIPSVVELRPDDDDDDGQYPSGMDSCFLDDLIDDFASPSAPVLTFWEDEQFATTLPSEEDDEAMLKQLSVSKSYAAE